MFLIIVYLFSWLFIIQLNTLMWKPKLVFSTNIPFQAQNTSLQNCVPSLGSFPSPLTVYPDFDSCHSHFMPDRMTPSVRHRAIEVHCYYYIIILLWLYLIIQPNTLMLNINFCRRELRARLWNIRHLFWGTTPVLQIRLYRSWSVLPIICLNEMFISMNSCLT